jgi:S-formylglutathione hydrolase
VDVGTADDFLKKGQLEPQALVDAAKGREEGEVQVRMQEGFDHSYYFVSDVLGEGVGADGW